MRSFLRFGTVLLFVPLMGAQTTESPTVVPPGHFFLEADVLSIAHNRITRERDGSRQRRNDAGVLLFNMGLTADWDVQIGWDGWTESVEVNAQGHRETFHGWGDVWLRTKWNFRGDEAVESAWSVLPYVKLPTAGTTIGNGKWEPGLALILGQPLSAGFWIQTMVSVDSVAGSDLTREATWFASAVVGSPSGWYAELLTEYETESDDFAVPYTVGVGYTHSVNDRLSIDGEILVGLNREAHDWMAVLRFTWLWRRVQARTPEFNLTYAPKGWRGK